MTTPEANKKRLGELLEYVHHVGRLNEKPIFNISEYRQLVLPEHLLKSRIGIQHDVTDEYGGSVWLKIERLKRIPPPSVPDEIKEWITVNNNPDDPVKIKDKIIKTLSESEVIRLINEGTVLDKDILDTLRSNERDVNLKDVIYRIENLPETKAFIDRYIEKDWYPWSESEKPRRETIKIYDALFSLEQTIESQGEDQPIELIWGIGVCRWSYEGYDIDHPLLEQLVEIDIDNNDGTLNIRPRNVEPCIALGPYFALDLPGVDALLRFNKKHFSELSEDIEFSPYISESFEPVLRQAATQLCESGIYWPDVNKKIENREPPKSGEELKVSDCWVLFSRPRSATSFVQDIERFQKKLNDIDESQLNPPTIRIVSGVPNQKRAIRTGGSIVGSSKSGNLLNIRHNDELYFPKEFNDAQVQIIDRLAENDGVVVQGPPGTGKTHTIANIISHYLATGRTVLVTSKGKPALDVLRDQIPEALRGLSISLLSNERQGFIQLEEAVRLLANIASQTNLRDLERDADAYEQRVIQLKRQINTIDSEIHEWGLKQIQSIDKLLSGSDLPMTAMELAQHVVAQRGQHDWLPDGLGPGVEFNPQFSDADIAAIRDSRRALGECIKYVNKNLPSISDLLDTAQMAAIHEDLVTSTELGEKAKSENLPPLSITVDNAVNRAKYLLPEIKKLSEVRDDLDNNLWLQRLFDHWAINGFGHEKYRLIENIVPMLFDLAKVRKEYLISPVLIDDPSDNRADIHNALDNLINGRKAFGLLDFRKSAAKTLLDKVAVHGEKPSAIEQWQHVKSYLQFQDDVRRFTVEWNSIGQEYGLPHIEYQFGDLFKRLDDLQLMIHNAALMATKIWKHIASELKILFPHGLNVDLLLSSRQEMQRAINAIESHTSRILLSAQRQCLGDLKQKLHSCQCEIADKLRVIIEDEIGNKKYSTDIIMKHWQSQLLELSRLHELLPKMMVVSRIAQLVNDSGAKKWAMILVAEPSLKDEDKWTPGYWYKSWQWKRQAAYIKGIDGRGRLSELSEQRVKLDKDLKSTFIDLVRTKTFIGLHQSMTDQVQSALVRFVAAISKIGKGTGKRAPRHRRDAYRAMQDCYDGVPCWIMPTWRICESLPSEFGSFDLVIIDEASQSDITALPAILRAKKILVVGDDKQVSPTAAFFAEEKILQLKQYYLRDQPFSELLLPGSSIYDLANAMFPAQRVMLTEHFRCVEPIIRFSMQFYTERLIPLRIPKDSERIDPPLVDVYVKGSVRDERKKINLLEIEAIVDEIRNLVNNPKYKKRSIGVISLIGSEQAKVIQDVLLRELGEDIYQQHNIACGDSAAFQGKEKDIVFLSMVVGPGQGAPLTKREYEQRFNVALSRARDRMYLYRSITESDLANESDLRMKVLRHFQDPMPQQKQVDNPLDICGSDFERDVYKKLTNLGYFVTPQVKVGQYSIDLVVEGENDRRLAIELDGDKYHPPEKWKDDFNRQRTMERVGWRFWRCWGSSYASDPDGCMTELINKLRSMAIHPIGNKDRASIYTEYREYIKDVNISEINYSNKFVSHDLTISR